MAVIPKNFMAGGSGHAPKGAAGRPSLKEILFDVADDLAGIKPVTVATVDAEDLPTAIALVNDLKAEANARAAYVIKTTKQT